MATRPIAVTVPRAASTTNGGTVNNLGRIDIAVAPSNPLVIYAQAQSINWNNNGNCGNTNGCQLGAWVSNDGGNSWTFMTGSAGGSLLGCAATGRLLRQRRLSAELV